MLRPPNIHFPPTRLICLENTHNRGGGTILPAEQMRAVYELAEENGLAVHLDGARIFHAAVAAGRPVEEFTRYADKVMFCLSKGLSACVRMVTHRHISRKDVGRTITAVEES